MTNNIFCIFRGFRLIFPFLFAYLRKMSYLCSVNDRKVIEAMQKLSSKEIIAIWFAVVSAAISITALWMPPQGIIDQSVLILIGQFLLFIATLTGVDGALTRLYGGRKELGGEPREAGSPPGRSGRPSRSEREKT